MKYDVNKKKWYKEFFTKEEAEASEIPLTFKPSKDDNSVKVYNYFNEKWRINTLAKAMQKFNQK
jgi:hypothetical protein